MQNNWVYIGDRAINLDLYEKIEIQTAEIEGDLFKAVAIPVNSAMNKELLVVGSLEHVQNTVKSICNREVVLEEDVEQMFQSSVETIIQRIETINQRLDKSEKLLRDV